MAEIKIGFFFLQLTGYAVYFWSLIVPWGDIKSLILFIAAMIFAVYKICNAHLDLRKKHMDFEEYRREQKKKRDLDNAKVNNKL